VFEKYYDLLIKAKFAGPSLAIAGIPIGIAAMNTDKVVPDRYKNVDDLGYGLYCTSVIVLSFLIIAFGLIWLYHYAKSESGMPK
jgi:hypothetical protein